MLAYHLWAWSDVSPPFQRREVKEQGSLGETETAFNQETSGRDAGPLVAQAQGNPGLSPTLLQSGELSSPNLPQKTGRLWRPRRILTMESADYLFSQHIPHASWGQGCLGP